MLGRQRPDLHRTGGVALGLVLAFALIGCGQPDGSVESPAQPEEVALSLPATTRPLAPAPIAARTSHVAVWTGTEMIVWGGIGLGGPGEPGVQLDDGAAYDPEADAWRVLAPAPLDLRMGVAASWAGDQLVLWGGASGFGGGKPFSDGASYDPSTDSWTVLPPAPLSGRSGARATWTGSQLLIWGGSLNSSRERQEPDGAAFDPTTQTWTAIPPAPFPDFYESGAVWTGTELVVLAGTFDHQDRGPIGTAYDPVAGTWRELADSPLRQGYALDLAWDGTEVVIAYPVPETNDSDEVASRGTTSAAYDPETDTWRALPRPTESLSWGTWVQAEGRVIFWEASPDPGTAYDIANETWGLLPTIDGPYREFPSLVWTGTEVIAWGGSDNCEAYLQDAAADCELAPLADGFALRFVEG